VCFFAERHVRLFFRDIISCGVMLASVSRVEERCSRCSKASGIVVISRSREGFHESVVDCCGGRGICFSIEVRKMSVEED
jgi:hypothetical protein